MNIPGHWRRLNNINWGGVDAATAWEHRLMPSLHVLRSVSITRDGTKWIHISVSRPDRLPTWAELNKVKTEFLGADIEAYQVLAADRDHVNVHSYCLHLWTPVGGVRRVANLQDLVSEAAF